MALPTIADRPASRRDFAAAKRSSSLAIATVATVPMYMLIAVKNHFVSFRFNTLASWMVLLVKRLHSTSRYVRVYLCRCQITVPKQHLNDPQIRTVVNQVRRECMT